MESEYLVHHGILGMKWGVRRYQNPDGTLTEAGKSRYRQENYKQNERAVKTKYGITNEAFSKSKYEKSIKALENDIDDLKIKDEDKEYLKKLFDNERIERSYKRDAHYGTIDDIELLELLTLEHESINSEYESLRNKYKSEEVTNTINNIKKFDTYTDGLFSDYSKGHEYLFDDDFIAIYENGLKGTELKHCRINALHNKDAYKKGQEMKSEYLVHHGVKGMKWGVRKEQPTSSSSRKKTSEKKYTEAEYKKQYSQARSRQFRIFLRAFAIGSALYGIRALQRKAMADKIADEVNKRIEHLNDVKVDGGTVSNSSTGKTVYNASHDTINDYLSKHGAGHLKFNADGTIDIVE